jgi:hypothetical protein
MNGMGLPVEYRVIHDYHVITDEAYAARCFHPAYAGRVLTGIRVECESDLHPSGGDGCFTPTFSPPALPCGIGEHPGGTSAAPSGVSPHHQQASKARWS